LLRAAARELGVTLDYEQTARLLALVSERSSATPRREELTGELRAERTPRELRLLFTAAIRSAEGSAPAASPKPAAVTIPIPGEGEGFGWHIRCSLATPAADPTSDSATQAPPEPAILRAAQPGDKVQLRHTRGAPKRIKEVLERMGIPAPDRTHWPVLAWKGEIIWMRGATLEPTTVSRQLEVKAQPAEHP
jgi:hypothetical protein